MNTTPDTPETPDRSQRSRRPMIAGVAAGLVAGGAIGLAAMVPSITSAAPDDTPALQDDTSVDAPADDSGDRPEAGTRLREALQPLVDEGTIDSTQADAVTNHLVENRPERDGHRHGRKGSFVRHASMVADLIGVDLETLRTELAAGSSVADVAEANGVDPQVVVDALVADAEAHAQMKLAHGADEDRVAERLENVTEQIEERIFTPRGANG